MNTTKIGGKLLLIYDVDTDDTNAYFRFFLGKYIPIMQTLGLEMSEAWLTAYGDFPNRLVGFIGRDIEQLLKLPQNSTWHDLNQELGHFVTSFEYKIIKYREGFQF